MSRFLLGYNTSGFSRATDIDAVAGWTAEAGFSAIEISFTPEHVMPADAERLARLARRCRAERLSVACGAGARHALGPVPHRPSWVSDDPEERRARLAFLLEAVSGAARLGARVLVFHAGPRPADTPEEAARGHLAAGLERLLPAAAREGVIPALEFHPSMLAADRRDVERLRAAFPDLKLTLDIGHLRCTEAAPLSGGIRDLLPATAHVHLEDIRGRVHEHLPIGDGDIPFGEVFGALSAGGYAGIVAAEFHSRSIDLDERELARRTFFRLSPLLA